MESILNSYATGDLIVANDPEFVGGLVGFNRATIFNSFATGDILGLSSQVGGLVGVNEDGDISNSFATGTVQGSSYVGGLVGLNHGGISNSYAKGNIINSGVGVGGLVGLNYGGIYYSYSTGTVIATNAFGGLVGVNYHIISNCFYDSNTSGKSDDDGRGEPKTTVQMKYQSTFSNAPASLNFSTIWKMGQCSNNGYPVLAWQTIQERPTISNLISASRCGVGEVTISGTPSAGEIKWYDVEVDGNEITEGSNIIIDGNELTNLSLTETITYYAEAVDGTCKSAVRTPVTATIYSCTKLIPQDCGATLEELNEILYYSPVANASNYEYWVEGPNGYSQTKLRGSNKVTMDMSWFPNLLMEATYTVKIRAFVDGVWQDYGDACNITTPKTKLRIGSCGLELTTWNKVLYYSAVYNATDYEYLVEGPNGYSQTKTRGSNKITMDISWFTGLLANATYTVKIRARVGGNWGDYGDACTITTPKTTNLISGSCGRILTALNKPLYYTEVYGATNYEYLVEGPSGYSQTHIRGNNKLTMDMTWLHNIQALTPSTIYTVKIRALVGGNWQDYGSACDITTPLSMGLIVQNSGTEMDKFETIALTAYPNPSNGEFTISSSHEGTFNIINELGQLVQTVEITKDNNNQVHVGSMQPGVYFITGTINGDVITEKIIVQ